MSKNILIIGKNGFLGRHIYEYLIDSYSVYYLNKKDIYQFISGGKIKFKIKFDVFINCIVDYKNTSAEIIESNFYLPIKICQNIKKGNDFKVFHFDSFYSKFFEFAPKNIYLLSKKSLLEWAEIFHNENDRLTTFILRLEHVVGKDEGKKKFNSWLIQSLNSNKNISLSNSNHKIDFIHIDDIVVLIKILIESNSYKNEYKILEVGTGKNHSIKYFAEKIKKKLNSKSKITFDKKLDNYKMKSSVSLNKDLIHLGWKPTTDLDEIIDLIL